MFELAPITKAAARQRTYHQKPVWVIYKDGTKEKIYGMGKNRAIGQKGWIDIEDIVEYYDRPI